MKYISKIHIAILTISSLLTVSKVLADETLAIELPTYGGETKRLSDIPIYSIEQPGDFPVASNLSCSQLMKPRTPTAIVTDGEDARLVKKLLLELSPNYGHELFLIAPDDLMFWVRTMKSISIQSIGVAVHETNHLVNTALSKCNDGFATYWSKNQIFKTEHQTGATEPYSIAAQSLPASLKLDQVGSRYSQYINGNGKHPQADFSILLDELLAYTGAASLEVSIVETGSLGWLVDPKISEFNVNIGGMADFMIYTLSYLKVLRTKYPDSYRNLKRKVKLVKLTQSIWSEAEVTLKAAFDRTTTAGKGGVLVVPREALAYAYSDSFISELDRLGITHMSQKDWYSTYLK